MIPKKRSKPGQAGFTLPEILVAVSMVGVLAAVVMPTIVGQISKGETSRVIADLQSVEQGNQMFRNDLGKYPTTVTDLVVFTAARNSQPALALTGNYPSNAATLWQGPYLARGDVGSGLETSGGTVELLLENRDWDGTGAGTSRFVAIAVSGLTAAQKDLVDQSVDGVAGADVDNAAHGKIRYDATTLWYYTSPVN